MKRLTNIGSNGEIWITDNDETRRNGRKESAYKKLAEYEDLEDRLNGVSVKQVVDGFIKTVENQTNEEYEHGRILTNAEADEWNEYKQLDEQGLLLRLPYQVGSTVYAICTCEAVGTVLDGTLYGSNGGFGTATGYYCPYELSDKCPHIDAYDCDECKNIESVFEDTIDYINITEYEVIIGLRNINLCVTIDEIGKTVFLTQEEAEQKLKEMKNNSIGEME